MVRTLTSSGLQIAGLSGCGGNSGGTMMDEKEKASLTKEQTNVKEKDDHPGYPIVHRSDYFHARAKYSFHRRPASNLPYIVMHAPQKMTRGALPSSCNSRNVSLFHETRSCES